MGQTIEYTFPPLTPESSRLFAASREREKREAMLAAERQQRTERISGAKEILEAGLYPSETEKAGFFGVLGRDIVAHTYDLITMQGTPELLDIAWAYYDRMGYTSYGQSPYRWLELLTPELRQQVETDLAIYVAGVWRSQGVIAAGDGIDG